MRARRDVVALLLVLAGALAPAPAAAQEEGAILDPDSPSAKEYAIPLDAARRGTDAVPGRAGDTTGGGAAQLFGEGVGSERSGGGSPPPSGVGGQDEPRRDGELEAAPEARAATPAVAPAQRTGPTPVAVAAGTGSSSYAVVGGVAGGVCVLAMAAGLLLRRREPIPG